MRTTGILILLSLTPGLAFGQNQPVRFFEGFGPGYHYQVSCRVNITGTLTLPPEKGQANQLALTGSSVIDYDERILTEKNRVVDKTIRYYRKMDFERKVGEQHQQSTLRPEVRRMVILRHKQFEVPFSPAGPMTWGEIDLVRTDVFTPALAGLLPSQPAKPGERWQANPVAVKELTDLEKIEEGGLTCIFESIATLVGRQQARIGFQGTVRGIGEDGMAKHQLEGHLFFDLVSNHLSYVYVKGTHFLPDKNGQPQGKVEGTFVLTREPIVQPRELADDQIRGLILDPNEDNTLLLYDNPELGVRFLYPRRWRVAGVSGKQIAIDENRGNGLLMTLDSLARIPTGAQFLQETRTWLNQQKAAVYRMENPKPLAPGVENFAADVDLAKQRLVLEYYVVRQTQGGATVAARLAPADLVNLRKDVDRIVKSVQITKQQ